MSQWIDAWKNINAIQKSTEQNENHIKPKQTRKKAEKSCSHEFVPKKKRNAKNIKSKKYWGE